MGFYNRLNLELKLLDGICLSSIKANGPTSDRELRGFEDKLSLKSSYWLFDLVSLACCGI